MTTTLTTIEWQDLLAVPFLVHGDDPAIGLDCWGIAREIARRAGLVFPRLVGPTPDTAGEIRARFHYLGARWSCIGEVGDLLLSDPERLGYVSHVTTVVDVERAMVLTTSKRTGPYCWPAYRARCELGVVRLAP